MNIAVAGFVIAFVVTAVIGKPTIKYLQKMKFGQKILEVGPKWHMSKQHTPTMGGIMFIVGILAALLIATFPLLREGNVRHLILFGFALVFGMIGFVDDYTKVKKKQNQGLTGWQKIVLQAGAAVLFLSLLRYLGYVTPNVYIPFLNVVIPVSWYLYLPVGALIVVGTVNAVNLTDGVDGLAAGVTLPVAAFFVAVFALWQMGELTCFAAALAGSLCAFLLYNFNPAKVFMGDTGSLFLGGAVAGMAFICDMPLVLVPVGIIYIIEALSDIIQVFYYKATKGKRIFKMAPLHHHLELSGWSEKKICGVFMTITLAMCILAYIGVLGRYLI